MEIIALTINGQKVTCPAGTSILLAAEKSGIKIPTLCFHPELKPHGACRVCLVEDEKSGRLMASCVTPAAPDMVIRTDTPRILNHRKNIVRLMMAEHPESCIVCSKGNRCELRNIAASLGVGEPGLYPMPNYTPYEELNPFIVRDLSKCILCGKCIRADHELVVTGAIDYNNRGFRSRPATLYEQPLENSICTFCGTCVSICPTGALSTKNTRYIGTPDMEANSICAFCGVGCSLTMGVGGGKIMEVNPSKRKISVNGATLCMRGHFANDFINTADRLKTPLIKSKDETDADTQVPVSWDEALETVTTRLSDIKRQHGPDSIMFIGSSKCTNEENFLLQKIAREIFESKNVANGGYDSGQKLISYIDERTQGSCRVNTLADLEAAEVIMVIGADLENIVPVAGYHVKRASKKGSAVIAIDPYKTDLAPHCSIWLRPNLKNAGQSHAGDLINALAAQIAAIGARDEDFINQYTFGLDAYIASLSDFNSQAVTKQFDIPESAFNQTVDAIKCKRIAFILSSDALNYPDGNLLVDAVINLALLTGSIGQPGAGIYVPAPENNLVGALDMGLVPDYLPGREKIAAESDYGLDLGGFIAAAESGKIKAAYIMGENLLRSFPQPGRVMAALQKLEFLVVQDIVTNRTTKIADIVLPGAAAYEKHGSFTNMEGRIQTFAPVVPPPGEARADWDILAQVAKVMGYPEQYLKIEKIRQEIRRVIPMYHGLGNHQQDWIKNSESDNPLLAKDTKFSFLPAQPTNPIPFDDRYPLMAKISPKRYHLGSGTRTDRSERITAYNRNGEIEISPVDCEALGLASRDRIRVKSEFGTIEREITENRHLIAGHVVIPMGINHNDVMNLAGLMPDEPSGTLGLPFGRVLIEKI